MVGIQLEDQPLPICNTVCIYHSSLGAEKKYLIGIFFKTS